jgi:hypothetical protein
VPDPAGRCHWRIATWHWGGCGFGPDR